MILYIIQYDIIKFNFSVIARLHMPILSLFSVPSLSIIL